MACFVSHSPPSSPPTTFFFPFFSQGLQYVTLYQTFLAARRSVVRNELEVSNKDAFMLASLSMQAIHGDFDPAKHTAEVVSKEELIPDANKDDIIRTSNIKIDNIKCVHTCDMCSLLFI